MLAWRADSKLTQAKVTETMARAERVACTPGDHHCVPLPDDVDGARQTCTSKGRCMIGWIVADAGHTA